MQPAGVDVTRESRGRLARVAAWFEATPAELTGLVVLVAGALLASVLLWVSADRRPDELPSPVAGVGAPVAEGALGAPLDPAEPDDDRAPSLPAAVTVHVTGAVATPGLVTLPGGARVGDAVAAAGGATADADPERLNLARPVEDGEHVHLPRHGEVAPPPPADGIPGGAVTGDGRVDINRATAAELETLPGIGPAKAAAVIRHREEHGPFAAPGDLRAVPGIGEATFQRLADLIVVP